MVKKNPLSVFNGKQGHMYAVLFLVWENYKQHLKDFQKKNAKYTEELAAQQTDAVKEARDLPDVAVRRDVPKEARDILSNAGAGCRSGWQDLSSLIENSFPPSEWSIKKGLAGSAYYKKASGEQWDTIISLTNAAAAFIAENTEALTQGGMLPDFPAAFAATKKRYDDLYEAYYGVKQDFNQQTTAKAVANNAVFKAAMSMMRDGKKIYRNDARARAGFTYESLMKIVRGQGFVKTGYRIILKSAATDAPVTEATIVFTALGFMKEESATAKGIVNCELPAGDYNFTLTAPAFTTRMGTLKAVESSQRQKTFRLVADTGAGFITTKAEAV